MSVAFFKLQLMSFTKITFAFSIALMSLLASCVNDDIVSQPDFSYESAALPTCEDGIMNGDEEGVDCGGSCEQCM